MADRRAKSPWILIDGSIYTVHKYKVKVESTKELKAPGAIAYNVGEELGAHIVNLHNASLKEIA